MLPVPPGSIDPPYIPSPPKKRKKKDRALKSKRRSCRVRQLAKANYRATALFSTGARPAGTFGQTCFGQSPIELHQQRRLASHSAAMRKGACATTVIELFVGPGKDPGMLYYNEIVRQWIWIWFEAGMTDEFRTTVTTVWHKILIKPFDHEARWGRVGGAICATIVSLLQIGWNPAFPNKWAVPLEQGDNQGGGAEWFDLKTQTYDQVFERAKRPHLPDPLAKCCAALQRLRAGARCRYDRFGQAHQVPRKGKAP